MTVLKGVILYLSHRKVLLSSEFRCYVSLLRKPICFLRCFLCEWFQGNYICIVLARRDLAAFWSKLCQYICLLQWYHINKWWRSLSMLWQQSSTVICTIWQNHWKTMVQQEGVLADLQIIIYNTLLVFQLCTKARCSFYQSVSGL